MKKSNNIGRRDFLKKSSIGVAVIGTAMIGTFSQCEKEDDSVEPDNPTGGGGTTKVTVDISDSAYKSLETVGNSVITSSNSLDSKGLLIYRKSDSEVVVYSRRCTHNGCVIGNFIDDKSTCPCHASIFDLSGTPTKGLATSKLKKYSATLSGLIITIS